MERYYYTVTIDKDPQGGLGLTLEECAGETAGSGAHASDEDCFGLDCFVRIAANLHNPLPPAIAAAGQGWCALLAALRHALTARQAPLNAPACKWVLSWRPSAARTVIPRCRCSISVVNTATGYCCRCRSWLQYVAVAATVCCGSCDADLHCLCSPRPRHTRRSAGRRTHRTQPHTANARATNGATQL